mgnify:CR=1 FL=1
MMLTPKDRFCKKAYILSKLVKPAIGCKWYKFYNQQQKDILLDICYMPEDLVDFLLYIPQQTGYLFFHPHKISRHPSVC